MNRVLADSRKRRPREELYIALSELDFSWYPPRVEVELEVMPHAAADAP